MSNLYVCCLFMPSNRGAHKVVNGNICRYINRNYDYAPQNCLLEMSIYFSFPFALSFARNFYSVCLDVEE